MGEFQVCLLIPHFFPSFQNDFQECLCSYQLDQCPSWAGVLMPLTPSIFTCSFVDCCTQYCLPIHLSGCNWNTINSPEFVPFFILQPFCNLACHFRRKFFQTGTFSCIYMVKPHPICDLGLNSYITLSSRPEKHIAGLLHLSRIFSICPWWPCMLKRSSESPRNSASPKSSHNSFAIPSRDTSEGSDYRLSYDLPWQTVVDQCCMNTLCDILEWTSLPKGADVDMC